MSTKIWVAYRIKPGHDLFDVMFDIRAHAERRIKKQLASLYRALLADWGNNPAQFAHDVQMVPGLSPADVPSPTCASDYVRRMYGQQLATTTRNPYDLSVSVTVRRAGRRHLLIPYSGTGFFSDVLSFMRRHPALEDYHYQNATDRPSKISQKDWDARARTWSTLMRPDTKWYDYLSLSIVQNGYDLTRLCPAWDVNGPFKRMWKQWHAKSRKEPAKEDQGDAVADES